MVDSVHIAYYMPFKPLGHPNPSGDLVIGTELYRYLERRGHTLHLASRLRTRWIYLRPWRWPDAAMQMAKVRCGPAAFSDLWLTYHVYYKAPDILGPLYSIRLGIPYVIFQGIYATKYRRHLKSWPGFMLNRMALRRAAYVFANKRHDYDNLKRIVDPGRLGYVRPGIVAADFQFDPWARQSLRSRWQVGERVVILSAAMFRPGVKTRGLEAVLRACAALAVEGVAFELVLVGEGQMRPHLMRMADRLLPGRVHFPGRIPRHKMLSYYSAADIFAFPGIGESLGMVYLEAQACGLPAVAFDGWGAREAILHGRTGLLSPGGDPDGFKAHLAILINNPDLRRQMGRNAVVHVHQSHDLETNYAMVEQVLARLLRRI